MGDHPCLSSLNSSSPATLSGSPQSPASIVFTARLTSDLPLTASFLDDYRIMLDESFSFPSRPDLDQVVQARARCIPGRWGMVSSSGFLPSPL